MKFRTSTVFWKWKVEEDGDVQYFPMHMVMCLKPQELSDEMIEEVDLSAL